MINGGKHHQLPDGLTEQGGSRGRNLLYRWPYQTNVNAFALETRKLGKGASYG